MTLGVSYLDNYRRPIGFEYRERVAARDRHGRVAPPAGPPRTRRVAGSSCARWSSPCARFPASWRSPPPRPARSPRRSRPATTSTRDAASPTATPASATSSPRWSGLKLVRGRFFSREDDAASWEPVVINQRLAREIFGAADPIGRDMGALRYVGGHDSGPPGAPPEPERRVVGVVADYRQEGEFDLLGQLPVRAPATRRARGGDAAGRRRAAERLRGARGAGLTADLEQRLVKTARARRARTGRSAWSRCRSRASA